MCKYSAFIEQNITVNIIWYIDIANIAYFACVCVFVYVCVLIVIFYYAYDDILVQLVQSYMAVNIRIYLLCV